MSPHTDVGEMLPSHDESTILELATRLLNDSADYFETLYQRHSIDVTRRGIDPYKLRMVAASLPFAARQAASQGRTGGEREQIAQIIDPNFPFWEFAVPNSFQQKRKNRALAKADAIRALSPPVKTGGEAETSLQNPQTSPAEVVKQHLAWLYQYTRGMNESNWKDMRLQAERQLDKMTAGGEAEKPFYGAECPSYPNCTGGCGLGCTQEIERSRAAAQTAQMQADIEQIISEGWRNGKSSAEVATEILREFDVPAQASQDAAMMRRAILGFLSVFDACGGSESVSPERFADARHALREAVAEVPDSPSVPSAHRGGEA